MPAMAAVLVAAAAVLAAAAGVLAAAAGVLAAAIVGWPIVWAPIVKDP